MRIPAAVLAAMLAEAGPGSRVVAERFRCRCEVNRTRACLRAATEEDGLCDGCRAHRAGLPAQFAVLADLAIATLPYPLDVCWPPAHVSVFAYQPGVPTGLK